MAYSATVCLGIVTKSSFRNLSKKSSTDAASEVAYNLPLPSWCCCLNLSALVTKAPIELFTLFQLRKQQMAAQPQEVSEALRHENMQNRCKPKEQLTVLTALLFAIVFCAFLSQLPICTKPTPASTIAIARIGRTLSDSSCSHVLS